MIRSLLARAWIWLRAKLRARRSSWGYQVLEDLPAAPIAGTVYLMGEGGHLWSAALLCPCGCGVLIQLNLLADAAPRWEATMHLEGTVSLYPSVWRTVGCKSHFVLRDGEVEWCRARERVRVGTRSSHEEFPS